MPSSSDNYLPEPFSVTQFKNWCSDQQQCVVLLDVPFNCCGVRLTVVYSVNSQINELHLSLSAFILNIMLCGVDLSVIIVVQFCFSSKISCQVTFTLQLVHYVYPGK